LKPLNFESGINLFLVVIAVVNVVVGVVLDALLLLLLLQKSMLYAELRLLFNSRR